MGCQSLRNIWRVAGILVVALVAERTLVGSGCSYGLGIAYEPDSSPSSSSSVTLKSQRPAFGAEVACARWQLMQVIWLLAE